MAKIVFSQKDKAQGHEFTGFEATYAGQTFVSKFWEGDTRDLATKIAAHKERLRGDAREHARKNSLPIPEDGE